MQAAVQVKKNKKKTKTIVKPAVKPAQLVSTNDGKETDDGEIQLLEGKLLNCFTKYTALLFKVIAVFLTCAVVVSPLATVNVQLSRRSRRLS